MSKPGHALQKDSSIYTDMVSQINKIKLCINYRNGAFQDDVLNFGNASEQCNKCDPVQMFIPHSS